jgi:hypothetical protein
MVPPHPHSGSPGCPPVTTTLSFFPSLELCSREAAKLLAPTSIPAAGAIFAVCTNNSRRVIRKFHLS